MTGQPISRAWNTLAGVAVDYAGVKSVKKYKACMIWLRFRGHRALAAENPSPPSISILSRHLQHPAFFQSILSCFEIRQLKETFK